MEETGLRGFWEPQIRLCHRAGVTNMWLPRVDPVR